MFVSGVEEAFALINVYRTTTTTTSPRSVVRAAAAVVVMLVGVELGGHCRRLKKITKVGRRLSKEMAR